MLTNKGITVYFNCRHVRQKKFKEILEKTFDVLPHWALGLFLVRGGDGGGVRSHRECLCCLSPEQSWPW